MIKTSPGQEKQTYEQILSLGVMGVRGAEDCATTGWRDKDGNLPSNREVAMSIYLGLLQTVDALYQAKKHNISLDPKLIEMGKQVIKDYPVMIPRHFPKRKIKSILE